VLILLLGFYVLRLAQSKVKAPNYSTPKDLGIFIAGSILIGSLQAVIGLAFSEDINLASQVGFAIANSISLIQLSLIVGIMLSFLQLTRKIKNSKERDFTEKEKKEIAEYKALQIRDRNLANFLHGNVQSRLSNLASHLERFSTHQEDSPPEYDELVSKVETIESELLTVLADFNDLAVSSKAELIDRITSIWRGIAEVKIEILYSEHPTTAENPTTIPLYELIFQTVNEAVGNAVRHGLATKVNIKLSPDGILTVEDNGVGVREGTSGLGTEHFNAVSESWTLEDTDTGTKLTLRINPDPII
jgi:signal transduction histidine kinase